MEISSLGSQLNNKKYGENDAREACRLNLDPMANHGNYMSQFLVRPFWRPYLHNPCFIICTIHLANMSISGWSCEIVKLFDDLLMFFHTIFRISHEILHLSW